MKLKIKRVHPDAQIPRYETEGAACFDLQVCEPGKSPLALGGDGDVVVAASTFSTGLAFEVPEGHVMLIFSRSGHGFKNGVRLANCVGVVDSDYRGELMIRLAADDAKTPLSVAHGTRIAQAMLVQLPQVEFEEVDDLSTTSRGTGGFGSTGS